jgi:hypothetical protein
MILGYVSNDEVNQDRFRRMADAFDIDFRLLDLRDDPTAEDVGAVVIDLDSWPPEDRERLMAVVLDGCRTVPVVVHSYNLHAPGYVQRLRGRGVVVLRRLSPAAFEVVRSDDERNAA